MTLLDVLLGAVREAPGQAVVHVRGDSNGNGNELTVTLRELLDDALRVAGGCGRPASRRGPVCPC